jgi:hypothetical protein
MMQGECISSVFRRDVGPRERAITLLRKDSPRFDAVLFGSRRVSVFAYDVRLT